VAHATARSQQASPLQTDMFFVIFFSSMFFCATDFRQMAKDKHLLSAHC